MIPGDGDLPKVVAAAIIAPNGACISLPPPARHHDVIRHMVHDLGIDPPIVGTQGFLLSDGSFAHRRMAWECAAYNGQFLPGKGSFTQLYSEDVW